MHRRILGLGSTLAFIFVTYIAARLTDPDWVNFLVGTPDAVKHVLEAFLLVSIFTFGVLFILVWPQTLLANWIVGRFHAPRFLPFALFFVVSSIIVGAFIILECLCGHWILKWLALTAYLYAPCCILWWISFRPRQVGYTSLEPTPPAH